MLVCLICRKAWQRMSGVDFFKFENVRPGSVDLLFAAGDFDLFSAQVGNHDSRLAPSWNRQKITRLFLTSISTSRDLPPRSKSPVSPLNSDQDTSPIKPLSPCHKHSNGNWQQRTLSSVPCVLPRGVRVIRESNPPLFGSVAAQGSFRKATMQPTRQTGFKRPLSPQILKSHDTFPDAQLAEGCLDPWQPLFRQPHQTWMRTTHDAGDTAPLFSLTLSRQN